jgi:NAD(P)-dependent dehydrogenase (short-subunit alcohol dehydrogenase family)
MAEGKTAIVTGGSTGIAFDTSLLLARNGFHMYATMYAFSTKSSDPISQ